MTEEFRKAIEDAIVRRQEAFDQFVGLGRTGGIIAPVEKWWLYHGIVEKDEE